MRREKGERERYQIVRRKSEENDGLEGGRCAMGAMSSSFAVFFFFLSFRSCLGQLVVTPPLHFTSSLSLLSSLSLSAYHFIFLPSHLILCHLLIFPFLPFSSFAPSPVSPHPSTIPLLFLALYYYYFSHLPFHPSIPPSLPLSHRISRKCEKAKRGTITPSHTLTD